jgi:hypothetical protein
MNCQAFGRSLEGRPQVMGYLILLYNLQSLHSAATCKAN